MSYKWIPTKKYTSANRDKNDIDVIVLHTMEFPEIPDAAERVANYFQTTSREVSAHYCVDSNSIVQCVHEKDVAWAAPGNNYDGIQIEQAGYAKQTRVDWNDVYSRALLTHTAKLVGQISRRYRIPLVFLDASDLHAGKRGVTTHAEVSKAWKKSDHTDPGPNYPMAHVLSLAGTKRDRLIRVVKRDKPIAKAPPTLHIGDKGWQVKRAQRLLLKHGLKLEVDGIFGEITLGKAKTFQAKEGLIRDGIIGPKTWRALLASDKETN